MLGICSLLSSFIDISIQPFQSIKSLAANASDWDEPIFHEFQICFSYQFDFLTFAMTTYKIPRLITVISLIYVEMEGVTGASTWRRWRWWTSQCRFWYEMTQSEARKKKLKFNCNFFFFSFCNIQVKLSWCETKMCSPEKLELEIKFLLAALVLRKLSLNASDGSISGDSRHNSSQRKMLFVVQGERDTAERVKMINYYNFIITLFGCLVRFLGVALAALPCACSCLQTSSLISRRIESILHFSIILRSHSSQLARWYNVVLEIVFSCKQADIIFIFFSAWWGDFYYFSIHSIASGPSAWLAHSSFVHFSAQFGHIVVPSWVGLDYDASWSASTCINIVSVCSNLNSLPPALLLCFLL